MAADESDEKDNPHVASEPENFCCAHWQLPVCPDCDCCLCCCRCSPGTAFLAAPHQHGRMAAPAVAGPGQRAQDLDHLDALLPQPPDVERTHRRFEGEREKGLHRERSWAEARRTSVHDH